MPNADINKVVLGDETLIDLTGDTATAADVAAGRTLHLASGASATGTASYAAAPENNGNANRTNAMLFGSVDSTSTATKFTATVEGLTELVDGTCIYLRNHVVTSASGFTLDVNGLGAKPCYNNLTNATRDTTIFNSAYSFIFIYDTSLNSGGGGWWIYRGYDANTNTIGYQLRTNSTVRNVSDTARYYKLYFTSADGTMWVPASVNSTNNATSARPVNQRPIDPFGRIVYTSANTSYAAGANLAAATIWDQYALVLGYSFNRTGAALSLTVERPVYVKCAPQDDGSAVMDATEPIVQALPTTDDGKIYIFLGIAYDATHIELVPHHPVYWHDGDGIRLWTGVDTTEYAKHGELSDFVTQGNLDNELTNYVRGADFQTTLDESTRVKYVVADATAAAVITQIMGGSEEPTPPSSYSNVLLVLNAVNNRHYLMWASGTTLESAPFQFEVDMATQAITMYARGLHSMAHGIAGVDGSWTIEALPEDAEGTAY